MARRLRIKDEGEVSKKRTCISWPELASVQLPVVGKGVILRLNATKLNCNVLLMRELAEIKQSQLQSAAGDGFQELQRWEKRKFMVM